MIYLQILELNQVQSKVKLEHLEAYRLVIGHLHGENYFLCSSLHCVAYFVPQLVVFAMYHNLTIASSISEIQWLSFGPAPLTLPSTSGWYRAWKIMKYPTFPDQPWSISQIILVRLCAALALFFISSAPFWRCFTCLEVSSAFFVPTGLCKPYISPALELKFLSSLELSYSKLKSIWGVFRIKLGTWWHSPRDAFRLIPVYEIISHTFAVLKFRRVPSNWKSGP